MSHKSRIIKLEASSQAAEKQYVCIYHADGEPNGYKVTPMDGSAGREPLHFATLEELHAFGSRPGVDLLEIRIVYASEAGTHESN